MPLDNLELTTDEKTHIDLLLHILADSCKCYCNSVDKDNTTMRRMEDEKQVVSDAELLVYPDLHNVT